MRSENGGLVWAAQLCQPLQRAAPLCEYQVHLILSMFSKGPGSSRLCAFDHTSRTCQAGFCFSSRALEATAEGGGGSECRLSSLQGLFHLKFCACFETYSQHQKPEGTEGPGEAPPPEMLLTYNTRVISRNNKTLLNVYHLCPKTL